MSKKTNGRQPRRRRVYIDADLQGRLVVALVALETSLLAAACLYLYYAFGSIIDDNLYVIHAADAAPMLPRMALELAKVVAVCAVVNTVALVVAHRLWARHVRRVLASLRKRLERVRALDLRVDPAWADEREVHRLIDLCDRWVDNERRRMVAVRIAAARLPRPLPAGTGPEVDDARQALTEAGEHLRRGGG